MVRPSLPALLIEGDAGKRQIAAPAPGRIRWYRLEGEVVTAGSRLGLLTENERHFDLVFPRARPAQLREVLLADPSTACEYGQVLAVAVAPSGAEAADPESQDTDSSAFEVRSPTHGTFYRRPSPDSPPYIEVGTELQRGDTLGLVEVMKCFSPITFDPPAGAERARVVEILAADGSEVRAEQPLVRMEWL
ncbi:MAG: biotin/lipoyl-containing protein [Acidobacteriota bacterium]|nr:biotin/lipoyl-containing protein [Acidobacteriota bacterium]